MDCDIKPGEMMQSNNREEIDEREELLAFVQELFGGYSEGMASPDFDHRGYLAGVVMQAYLLYVQFELKPRPGNC